MCKTACLFQLAKSSLTCQNLPPIAPSDFDEWQITNQFCFIMSYYFAINSVMYMQIFRYRCIIINVPSITNVIYLYLLYDIMYLNYIYETGKRKYPHQAFDVFSMCAAKTQRKKTHGYQILFLIHLILNILTISLSIADIKSVIQ